MVQQKLKKHWIIAQHVYPTN